LCKAFNAKVCDVNRDGNCDVGDALLIGQCASGLRGCDFDCKPFACPAGK
jgi:hypothetical protein